jgi:hypothetical protein
MHCITGIREVLRHTGGVTTFTLMSKIHPGDISQTAASYVAMAVTLGEYQHTLHARVDGRDGLVNTLHYLPYSGRSG